MLQNLKPNPHNLKFYSAIVYVLALIVFVCIVLAGCKRPPARSDQAVLDSLANIYPGIRQAMDESNANIKGLGKFKYKPTYNITIKDKSTVDNSVTDKSTVKDKSSVKEKNEIDNSLKDKSIVKEKTATSTKDNSKSKVTSSVKDKSVVKEKTNLSTGVSRSKIYFWLLMALAFTLYFCRRKLLPWFFKVFSFIFTKSTKST